jgi:hypothetical protein
LSYNLCVGTSSGNCDVRAADYTGTVRTLPGRGALQGTNYTLSGLDGSGATTYYWQVQAVDTAFAASGFSPEGRFNLTGTTLVTLTAFTVTATAAGVQLAWSTAAEVDSLGFQVWRRAADETAPTRLTVPLIPARGSVGGADYTYLDTTALAGARYHYTLVELDSGGNTHTYGPLEATPVRSAGRPEARPEAAAPSQGGGSLGLPGLLGLAVLERWWRGRRRQREA